MVNPVSEPTAVAEVDVIDHDGGGFRPHPHPTPGPFGLPWRRGVRAVGRKAHGAMRSGRNYLLSTNLVVPA